MELYARQDKENHSKKTKEIKGNAINVLERTADYIKTTSVGKTVQKVIDVVKPTLREAVETGKRSIRKVKDFAKSFFPF